ncbi:MAG: penicillin acylase family protein [SAR324 cluster bacterium]
MNDATLRTNLSAALPDVTRPLRLKGLDAPLTVYRDRWGIPHIQARTAHDAWFGQGFATAQDRMAQMDYDRRRAAGRWAEAAGPSALAADRQARRFQIVRAADTQWPRLKPRTRGMLDAYAAGVNAFLQDCRRSGRPAAFEFTLTGVHPEPWSSVDSMAVYIVRHILMGGWESKAWRARLLARFGPARMAALLTGYEVGQLVIVPPDTRFEGPALDCLQTLAEGLSHLTHLKEWIDQGSNNWGVGGSRTRSGKPLVAGDPHRALDVPNVYYQCHMACRAFDIAGLAFPGVPGFPHFAHNAGTAWCVTHGEADIQDLYIERFNPAHPHQYEVEGSWAEAEVTRSPIQVRGGATVVAEVARTRHGPVVAGDPRQGTALALAYTGTGAATRTFDAIFDLHAVRNADELEAALRTWCDPVNNLVYAGVDGQFGYRARGRLPIRAEANALLPVPGWSGAHEWRGDIPFEEMPTIRNPSAGYVYTANNRIPASGYPHALGHDVLPGFRAERIGGHLRDGQDLTVADMARIHADLVSIPAQQWRPLWPRVAAAGERERWALDTLRAWDCRVTRESVAALLFHAFRAEVLRIVLPPILGPLTEDLFRAVDRGGNGFLRDLLAQLHRHVGENRTALLQPGVAWDAVLAQALAAAVARLDALLGPNPGAWRWDALHRTAPQHPLAKVFPEAAPLLNPRHIPMAGDGDTVQAGGFYPLQTPACQLISVARYVFDLGDWERSTWIVPGGASGHPASPHWQDQGLLYEAHETIPMLYGWQRIAREAETVQRLSPAG